MPAIGICSFPSFKWLGPVSALSWISLAMTCYALTLALLALAGCICCTFARATPDEERYVEKEYNRDLYDWINNAVRYAPVQPPGPPCKYPYFLDNSLNPNMRMPKRNSELINSLLSLPKNMNDAGK
ncbi:protein PDF isoform X2 [Drosophila virilis]|nr:uncharacterized protein Dvir_GJ27015, isoform A [Drosophila virilis]